MKKGERKREKGSDGDAFDLKPGMLEIQEEGSFQARDVEVAEHLGDVGFVESTDHLGIDDDCVIDNEIGDEGANEVFVVMNGMLLLLIAHKALFCEFDDKGSFVELFIQARSELV